MNQIILIKIVIQLVLNVLKLELQQVIIVIHVFQDIHLYMEKEVIVMLILIIMMDIIKMKMMVHGKNVMTHVLNVQEKEAVHVQDVLLDITSFIINQEFVFLINQMTAIMMKKMIHLKNVMINVENVLKKEMIVVIIVLLVLHMKTEHIFIILFMMIMEIVILKKKSLKIVLAI